MMLLFFTRKKDKEGPDFFKRRLQMSAIKGVSARSGGTALRNCEA
jgi:hypothetical protein